MSARPCRRCGTVFTPAAGPGRPRLFCSDNCCYVYAKKIARSTRRVRERGISHENFHPREIYERDGWTCQLCHLPVRRATGNRYHPEAPSIDHVIPLSRGGLHTRANVQCAHHRCNSRKAATLPQEVAA